RYGDDTAMATATSEIFNLPVRCAIDTSVSGHLVPISSPILSSCLTAIGLQASYSKYKVLLPLVNSRAIQINVLIAPASGRTTLFIHSSIEIGWGVIQYRSISFPPHCICLFLKNKLYKRLILY